MNKRFLSIVAAVMLLLMLAPVSASAIDTVVNTGVTHNWILPVVLISVALLVIIGLLVTKKKKPENNDVNDDSDNNNDDNNFDETTD